MTVLPFEHADEAAAALREIVAEQGPGILSDPMMLGSLLADLLPAAPSAVRILVAAAEDHVADAISDNVSQGIGPDAAVRLAATSFAKSSLSAPEVSQWVATTFAAASGLPVSAPASSPGGSQGNFFHQSASGQQGQPGQGASWPPAGSGVQAGQPGAASGPPRGFQAGPQPGFASGPQAGPQAGPQPGIQSGPQAGPQPAFAPGPQSPPQPGYQSGPQPGYQSGPQPGGQQGFQSAPQPGYQSGPQAGFQSAPQPGAQPGSPPFGYQGYQPPAGGQLTPAQKQQYAPQPVLNAVKLMYAGIALSVLLAIADFVEVGHLGSLVYTLTPHQDSEVAASAFGGVISLLGIGMWILMAWANRRGMSWARIVGTILLVFFVLYTLFTIVFVTPFSIVLELGTLGVGVTAVVFMWRSESSAYYQISTQPPVR